MFVLPMLAASTLAGCVKYNGKCKTGDCEDTTTQSTSSSNTELPPGTTTVTTAPVEPGVDVTYYLNLGKYGKYNGTAGSEQAEVFLEFGVKLTGKSGDALPGKDLVTPTQTGAVFEKWVLYGSQDIYSVIPNINNAVLVAVFTSNNGESSDTPGGGGGGGTPALPTTGFGFLFSDNTKYYLGNDAGYDYDGRQQKLITNAVFKAGEKFRLYDFGNSAGWTIDLDPYSLGGTTPTSENWKSYLSKAADYYTVLQDFTSPSIYIKLSMEIGDQLYIQ